jgi:hypothetical protein
LFPNNLIPQEEPRFSRISTDLINFPLNQSVNPCVIRVESTDLRSKLLNVGCGVTVAPGWVNVDYTEHVLVTRIPGMAVLLYRLGLLDAQHL